MEPTIMDTKEDEKPLILDCDEKREHIPHTRALSRNRKQKWISLLHGVYSYAITILAIFLLGKLIARPRDDNCGILRSQSRSPFGDIPLKPVVWHDDAEFSDPDIFRATMNGSITGRGWDALRLRDNYWLELPIDADNDDKLDGLPPRFFNSTSTTTEAFVPAFHHQLHCLMAVKSFTLGLTTPSVDAGHAAHCIELIRQALICSADLSLEHPSNIDDEKWGGPSGWDHTHQCKDWDAIDKVITRHGLPQASLLANAEWLETA